MGRLGRPKGIPQSAEARRRIGEAAKRSWTPERRAAQSKRLKERWASQKAEESTASDSSSDGCS